MIIVVFGCGKRAGRDAIKSLKRSARFCESLVAEHGAARCNAAGLIDGDAGTARVLRLMSGLREASRLDWTTRRRLVVLHRLLSLDPVADGFESELSSWILLDLGSPEVEDLCLLTDRLYDLLVVIGEVPRASGA